MYVRVSPIASRRTRYRLESPPFVFHGPFLFGATDKLDLIVDRVDELPTVVLLRTTEHDGYRRRRGCHAIERLVDRATEDGALSLVICGLREQPRQFMYKAGFEGRIGGGNLVPSLESRNRPRAELLKQDE